MWSVDKALEPIPGLFEAKSDDGVLLKNSGQRGWQALITSM
jgi:hypothetical protein